MEQIVDIANIPVLLLHNIDPAWEPEAVSAALGAVGTFRESLEAFGHPVEEVPVYHADIGVILAPFAPEDFVVFNWCEELPGEPRSDVRVAAFLESCGYTFTGASAETLNFSWDKAAGKALLNRNRVLTPDWKLIPPSVNINWKRFPAIVKPALEHCSIGITSDAVVLGPEQMKARISYVWEELRQPAIVEDFIDGREFHVTFLGNSVVDMLPPAEMDFSALDNIRDRLCTFDAKFTPGSLHYEKIEMRIPAPLDARQTDLLGRTALSAYRLFNCRDYGRIDIRRRDDRYYVLDVNPNADVSPDTSFAFAAEAAGLSYGAVASRLVCLAAERHPMLNGCSMVPGTGNPAVRHRRGNRG